MAHQSPLLHPFMYHPSPAVAYQNPPHQPHYPGLNVTYQGQLLGVPLPNSYQSWGSAFPVRHTLENWDAEQNKDKEEYYADAQFRWDYTVNRMLHKAADCQRLVWDQMRNLILSRARLSHLETTGHFTFLPHFSPRSGSRVPPVGGAGNIFHFTDPTSVPLRILSLGCGPGTDLLAVVRACVGIGGVRRIQCVGVDKFQWPTGLFMMELSVTLSGSASFTVVQPSFVQCDSAQFVSNCILSGVKFDLVISCYARAREKCQLFGFAVPQILNNAGRIFVVDNNSHELKDGLTRVGFSTVCERISGKLIFLAYFKSG